MIWNKENILRELRRLHRSGADLSYNALARRKQSLLSAAAYHFGSYRSAVAKAGIDYDDVIRRPRWTRQNIIRLIKEARRKGEDLHWSAVTSRGDELARAAFAALQPRLFGRWDRALHAAGLDADDVSMYRAWDRNSVIFELKSRAQEREALNSGALQQEDPGLYAAAVRYFGSYDKALRAAMIDPQQVRRRRNWTRQSVVAALKSVKRGGQSVSDSVVRKSDPALYGAAVRLFGTFTAARNAAGIATPKSSKKVPRRKTA